MGDHVRELVLEVGRGPSGHPSAAGGRTEAVREVEQPPGSRDTVTFGTCGLATMTVPPKLSCSESSPTVAKSFSTGLLGVLLVCCACIGVVIAVNDDPPAVESRLVSWYTPA